MEIKRDGISVTRREVEAKLATMGDYVKIDYLSRCLKQTIDFDTRKFVLVKLSEMYENKGMVLEAAKMMSAGAEINSTYQSKINDYTKAAELFIRSQAFDEADVAFNKALACANGLQKDSIKNKRKALYQAQAKLLMQKDKRKNAMQIFEKLLSIELSSQEKREVQSTLLDLYEKLGKVKEFYSLKRNMDLS